MTIEEAFADLTEEEEYALDSYMSEHMYRHSISNSYSSFSCDAGCRMNALSRAVRKHVLIPRLEKFTAEIKDPVLDPDKRDEVNRIARVLIKAWQEAEGKEVNVSYVATFADMARAVIADRG